MTTGDLKKVSGQIATIDHAARKFTVKDKDGIITPLVWTANLDQKMQKQKPYWFVSCVCEGSQIDSCEYYQKPADWPQVQKVGGWQGKPRNERLIVLQSSLKVCADLFQYCHVPDTQDYESACALVYEQALEMTNKAMKDGGQ